MQHTVLLFTLFSVTAQIPLPSIYKDLLLKVWLLGNFNCTKHLWLRRIIRLWTPESKDPPFKGAVEMTQCLLPAAQGPEFGSPAPGKTWA